MSRLRSLIIENGIIDASNLLDLPSLLEQIGLESEAVVDQAEEPEKFQQALRIAEEKAEAAAESALLAQFEAKRYRDAAQQTEAENERLRSCLAEREAHANKSQDLCHQLSEEVDFLRTELARWQHRGTQTESLTTFQDAEVQVFVHEKLFEREREVESLRDKLTEACNRLKKAALAREYERQQRDFQKNHFEEIVKANRKCLREIKSEIKELEDHCLDLSDRLGLKGTDLDDTQRMMQRLHVSQLQQEKECLRLHALLMCNYMPEQQHATQQLHDKCRESKSGTRRYLSSW